MRDLDKERELLERAGLVETGGGAALMLARVRSRIEAAAPFPPVGTMRVADALGDRPGMDVAIGRACDHDSPKSTASEADESNKVTL